MAGDLTPDEISDMYRHIQGQYEQVLNFLSQNDDRVVEYRASPDNLKLWRAYQWFIRQTPEDPQVWYKRTVLKHKPVKAAGMSGSGLGSSSNAIKFSSSLVNSRSEKGKRRIYL